MAIKGQKIVNKITSDVIAFLQTREDTNGGLLQFDNFHAVDGIGPLPHSHPLQEETFIVKKRYSIYYHRRPQPYLARW